MNNPNTILVIRFSSLGDVLLTTPVLRALKIKYPNTKIDFLVKEEYAEVIKYNPLLNELILYHKDCHELIEEKIANKYDLIIDLQNNYRSRRISKTSAKKYFLFRKPTFRKFLLVNLKINLLKDYPSIPIRYADSVDLKLDEKGLDIYLPENIKSNLSNENNYIGLCPGSKHYTKRWLKDYYIELGNKLIKNGFDVVIFGGKDDKAICDEIESGIEKSINLCNDNDVLQIFADMQKCKLILCNDSGLMHVAAAAKKPLITIFGSSVKEFGFIPYGVPYKITENKSLSCRPCSHIGRTKCPKNHFKCMTEILPDKVLQETLLFIEKL